MSRAGPGPSSLRRSLPLTPALPSGLPPTEGPRPLRVRGEGALPTTSPPHIVSTAGSRGRARAVPLAAPHAAGGRNFPSNAATRVGRPRSGSLESPPNVPPRESGLAVVGPSAALAPSAPPPEVDAGCPWGTSPPPPADGRSPAVWLPFQAGQVGGDTAAHSGYLDWTPGRTAAWHRWTPEPADPPPGTRTAALGTMAIAFSSAMSEPVGWRVGQGRACARAWGTGSWNWGVG